MRLLFWLAAGLVLYTYLGYVAWLWVRSHWHPRPVKSAPILPLITIVMVVRNEAAVLKAKLENLTGLNYPVDRREIVVVSDGSTDSTNSILAESVEVPGLHFVLNTQGLGKARGINDAMMMARGDVIVFTDARQWIEPDAVRLLMENFADHTVVGASGELRLGDPVNGEPATGMGLYWKIEKRTRELESTSGSTAGATGAFYALRRDCVANLPQGTILDDVYLPMYALRLSGRVVLDTRARAWDVPSFGLRAEFARKVRTLTGNYQLLQSAPWLLGPHNPIWFEFVSHKLLRLLVPFALGALLMTSVLLPGPIYRIFLALQLAFYSLSILALVRLKIGPLTRLADAALTFVLLNTAAVVAFANFLLGRKAVWAR